MQFGVIVICMNNRIQGQHSRFQRERDHNDKNEQIMGNGKNDAKAGKQKQQKMLIFLLLGHEWVGQGPGFKLGEHGQVDGASIIANHSRVLSCHPPL